MLKLFSKITLSSDLGVNGSLPLPIILPLAICSP